MKEILERRRRRYTPYDFI